jgi:hypothetical protein
MKFIKSRKKYLNEAKIRDVIFTKQANKVIREWGESYLDYEEVTPTNKIKQGKWKLSEEDKNRVLGSFFDCDMTEVFDIFSKLPDKLMDILGKSINLDLLDEKFATIFEDFNIKNPTIDQIVYIYDNVFRKLSLSETQASEMIQKDENGRPVRDEEGNMIKITKNPGDPIYSNNLVNINSFIDDYNRCYPDDKVEKSVFSDYNISSLRNLALDEHNSEYDIDFEIFNKDIYLSISHNPKDILNISISKFYSSCQHLYSGGWNEKLLGNVFDPNSIPAFLIFETPIFWGDEKISDHLPLSRMIIRNIETFRDDDKVKIFFDRAYPDRMKSIFDEIIEKYSENISNVDDNQTYIFTPDIDSEDRLETPYMDRLGSPDTSYKYIGVNTKSLTLSRNYNWSKCRISPNAKIKELVIETTDIPEELLKINLNPDWVKFKYLTINTLEVFSKVRTNSIAFDKCKFDSKILEELNSTDIEKIQIISCDFSGVVDFSKFTKLEELHLIYTINSFEELKKLTENLSVKSLFLSSDLIREKSTKEYIQSLRKKGIKIEIIGPQI